jgi:hypothetical protein
MEWPIAETTGPQFRFDRFNRGMNRIMRTGELQAFAKYEANAYDLYVMGLVERVGWDTMQKAIQSYGKNSSYVPVKEYICEGLNSEGFPNINAHKFFDRVAHFHDQARAFAQTDPRIWQTIPLEGRSLSGEQVLHSLPDQGMLFNQYFAVKTKPIVNVQIAEQPQNPAGAVTIPSSPSTETAAPETSRPARIPSGRSWRDPNFAE